MEAGDNPAPIDPKPEAQGVGATLRARRLELGLSQSDVAAIVKLPPRRIEAMERERWDELPDGPYLRGFLRNVARALQLDAAALVERVEGSQVRPVATAQLVPPGSTHVPLPRRSGPADERRSGRPLVFLAFVFAVIAALIAWSGTDSFDRVLVAAKSLVHGRDARGATAEVREPVATEAGARTAGDGAAAAGGPPSGEAASTTEPVAPPSSQTAAAATSTLPAAASNPAAVPAPVAAVPSPAAAAASASALVFHFSQDSWVEVRSADGKVLLQRLNPAGSEQQVQGDAPFTLIVGNAKGVTLQFRGQPVDLAPYTRDAVARFKLS